MNSPCATTWQVNCDVHIMIPLMKVQHPGNFSNVMSVLVDTKPFISLFTCAVRFVLMELFDSLNSVEKHMYILFPFYI